MNSDTKTSPGKTRIEILSSEVKHPEQDYKEALEEDNLVETVSDMSLPDEIRLEALESYHKLHGEETVEVVNKLAMMYQFSGLKLLRNYLYEICVKTGIHPFLKTFIIKSLCAYDSADEIGYKALDIVYPSMGDDVPMPCKVEIVILLMKCKKFRERARDYFCDIVNTDAIECEFRYKTILSLEHLVEKKKTQNYFIREACWEFIQHNNPTRYRVLAGQCLLQRCKVTKLQREKIEQILLSFATDGELDYNIRADSADVLLQLGNDENKLAARDIILMLGRENHLVRTVYDNAQNVHTEEIDESVLEIVEFLATMPTMTIKTKKDLEDEKNFLKTVSGMEIGFSYVKAKIMKIIEEEKKGLELKEDEKYEREENIKISLSRIEMDRALYSKFNCSLSMVLVKVWTYIQGHESEEEMKIRLFQELEEMAGTCSSGYLSRLVNSITGFGDFSLRISWRDQIIANLGGRLNARARKIDDLDFADLVICEMAIQSHDYQSRKHFLRFFRQNLLSIREEMYQEFKDYIPDTDFDLHFRAAVSQYESGSYV
jgi:hypothetical protein